MLDLSRGAVGLRIAATAFTLLFVFPALAPQADAEIGRAHLDGTGVEQGFITTPAGAFTLDVAVDGDHVSWTWSIDSGGGAVRGVDRPRQPRRPDVEPKFMRGLGLRRPWRSAASTSTGSIPTLKSSAGPTSTEPA